MRYYYIFILFISVNAFSVTGCKTSQEATEQSQRQRVLEERIIALEGDKINSTQKNDSDRNANIATKADVTRLQNNIGVLNGEVKKQREDHIYTVNQMELNAKTISDLTAKNELLEKRVGLMEIELEKLKKQPGTVAEGGVSSVAAVSAEAAPDEEALYQRAYKNYAAKKYNDAMTDFSEYRVRYPKGKYSDKTYYFIGGIHFSNETNDKAAQELSDMTKLYPSSDKINDARFLLAVTYERMKDKDRAIKLYREMAKEAANPYKTKAEARLKEISKSK